MYTEQAKLVKIGCDSILFVAAAFNHPKLLKDLRQGTSLLINLDVKFLKVLTTFSAESDNKFFSDAWSKQPYQ